MRCLTLVCVASLALGCGDISVPAAPPADQICEPGSIRCSTREPKSVEKCNDAGTSFVFAQQCGVDEICSSGACQPGQANVVPCAGGCPPGEYCKDGKCNPAHDPACGEVSYVGCCANGELRYCENGKVNVKPCPQGRCGWAPSEAGGLYECGFEGPDPSGAWADSCGGGGGGPGGCGSHEECGDGQFCGNDNGNCDGEASCRPRPAECEPEPKPVCGCNNQTYENKCHASREGISVAKIGACN